MPKNFEGKPETYINPVYPHSFPDPFVLKFRGEYFAYCTGDASDGNVFGILRSADLVNWSSVGGAMAPLESRPPFYWAPEVTYDNGKFCLYYSAGNEILMEIRVAVSNRPDGGFVDQGVRLTHEEFAIDAHVFIDNDGTRYMFYATDFLEYAHIGTGTVVDRMIDWKTLEGKPRPVARAKYDWQVYDPARKEKGGVRWYTVEGPTILKRKGKYFEMFSGGNWQNKSYGVSFAVTDDMKFTSEWTQFSDGEKVLPIVRTIPDKVIGPGHNSVVRGPNNRELFCVYHRWTDADRVLAIDRMDFAGDRIFVAGPTTTEQPAPFRPFSVDAFLNQLPAAWSVADHELLNSIDRRCELPVPISSESFLFECTFRFREIANDGGLGIEIGHTRFDLSPTTKKATLRSAGGGVQEINLSADFNFFAFHLLRIEKNAGRCRLLIDDLSHAAEVASDEDVSNFLISTDHVSIALLALELTPGFEELFESAKLPASISLEGNGSVSGGRLILSPKTGSTDGRLIFSVPFAEFEIAANLAVSDEVPGGEYGLALFDSRGTAVARLTAKPEQSIITFETMEQEVSIDLPEAFVGTEFRQFRLLCLHGCLSSYLDGIFLSELPFAGCVTEATIFGSPDISAEMLRLTAI